ncbi:MAG: hypothetical protein COA86_16340 [Kangiella sp.]|nr:MAG: hypothetical protein COA86_16340 [Kangiella sp.]
MPKPKLKIIIKKHCFALIVLLYQISINPLLAEDKKIGWHQETMQHEQLERHYRYYLPPTKIKKPPLVILLHGGTQNMFKLFNKHAGGSKEWQTLADKNGFILLTPNGTSPTQSFFNGQGKRSKLNWNDCRAPQTNTKRNVKADDIGFIKKLILWSIDELSINSTKIYVTGASNGGMMTYRVASELSNQVTAVASFIANLPEDSECELPKKPIPMLIMNGSNDAFMPWNGGDVKGKGGKVLSTADTLEFWLLGNNSDKHKPVKYEYNDINQSDHSRVVSTCYPALTQPKRASAETCLFEIIGGGHVTPSINHQVPKWIQKRIIGWQNKDIEGARIAWEFFEKF